MRIKRKLFFYILTAFTIVGIVIISYPVISSIISPSSQLPVYNVSYGSYVVPVYNQNSLTVKLENITGIKLTIDNIDQDNLTIESIQNSTTSLTVKNVYIQESVVTSNGSVITAFVNTGEIFIGRDLVIIPVSLHKGSYTIILSNGETVLINVT